MNPPTPSERIRAILFILFILVLFAIAGTIDLQLLNNH